MKLVPAPRPIWTALPEAAAILADCVANPPATRVVKVQGLSTYHEEQFVGEPVKLLRRIHRAEADRLMADADASRNYDAFSAHCALTVQSAIRDALITAALARSAAHDSALAA